MAYMCKAGGCLLSICEAHKADDGADLHLSVRCSCGGTTWSRTSFQHAVCAFCGCSASMATLLTEDASLHDSVSVIQKTVAKLAQSAPVKPSPILDLNSFLPGWVKVEGEDHGETGKDLPMRGVISAIAMSPDTAYVLRITRVPDPKTDFVFKATLILAGSDHPTETVVTHNSKYLLGWLQSIGVRYEAGQL
jgi:hypothetical protein